MAWIIFSAIFTTTVLVLWILLWSARGNSEYWRHRLEYTQTLYEREEIRCLTYERAMGLPFIEPQRSQELWARACQGDELAEMILAEELSLKTESPEIFTGADKA